MNANSIKFFVPLMVLIGVAIIVLGITAYIKMKHVENNHLSGALKESMQGLSEQIRWNLSVSIAVQGLVGAGLIAALFYLATKMDTLMQILQ